MDILRLFGLAVIENFGYRQLTLLWRARGLIRGMSGAREWGERERRGFGVDPQRV